MAKGCCSRSSSAQVEGGREDGEANGRVGGVCCEGSSSSTVQDCVVVGHGKVGNRAGDDGSAEESDGCCANAKAKLDDSTRKCSDDDFVPRGCRQTSRLVADEGKEDGAKSCCAATEQPLPSKEDKEKRDKCCAAEKSMAFDKDKRVACYTAEQPTFSTGEEDNACCPRTDAPREVKPPETAGCADACCAGKKPSSSAVSAGDHCCSGPDAPRKLEHSATGGCANSRNSGSNKPPVAPRSSANTSISPEKTCERAACSSSDKGKGKAKKTKCCDGAYLPSCPVAI